MIEAHAHQLRVAGDRLNSDQRRADALTAVVAAAHCNSTAPAMAGPAAVVLTLPLTEAERVANNQSRTTELPGIEADCHTLGDAAARFGLCCADIAPAIIDQPNSLIAKLTDTQITPLALGRSQRLASPGQRTALMLRDKGCVITGCTVPAQHCQAHLPQSTASPGGTPQSVLAVRG